MKKRSLSPLVSGLIYPGAGQLLNGHIVKGWTVILLTSLDLVFLVIYIFKGFKTIIFDLSASFESMWEFIAASLTVYGREELILLILLLGLWIYAIVDAYIGAPTEEMTTRHHN